MKPCGVVLVACVLAAASCIPVAMAQDRPGGNGPLPGDPGYVDPNGGYADPNAYGYAPPPPVDDGRVDSWASVAIGTRAGQAGDFYWFIGQQDTWPQAKAGALAYCARDGGQDCRIADTVMNGYMGIAASADGHLFVSSGVESAAQAEYLAVGQCKYDAHEDGCHIVQVHANPVRQR